MINDKDGNDKNGKKKKSLAKIDSVTFFYFTLLTFVFITSSALALSRFNEKPIVIREKIELTSFTPIPELSDSSNFPILSAQAALAVDIDSGISLYEKNPNTPLLPASTTKIITALVAMDNYSLETNLTVGKFWVEGQKMGLREGEKIRVDDLLQGLLIFSANDAAEVLALNYPGGRSAFIDAMNEKARTLSLENSNFKNPTGLDGNGHSSTARDLVRVSEFAMRNKKFAQIVATKEKSVTSVDGKIAHKLINLNELVGKVEGVLGVKTGWTEVARENLVTYIERVGHRVMIALLGSQDRFGETEELISWIFENYEWQEVSLPQGNYSP